MNTVKVLYKYVDGAHFFVSDDEKTLGLCVAHTDPKVAYEAVSKQLTKLFKENYGEDAKFVPSVSLNSFLGWLESQKSAALSGPMPGSAGIFPWSTGLEEAELAIAE